MPYDTDVSSPINISILGPEDFMTYSLVNPEGNITRTSNQVNWDLANRNVQASLYKNYEPGFFGDFTHTFKTLCSYQQTTAAIHGIWGVSNGAFTLQQIINEGGISLFWWTDGLGNRTLRLSQYVPTLADYSVPLSLNVEYSITVSRVGTTLTCSIVGGSVNDVLTVAGVDPRTYNTIVTYHSYNNASASATATGYSKDLEF